MPQPVPSSLSVYRGHAPAGIGEGEARRSRLGEQYIHADPPLGHPSTLDTLRSWFTLDAPNADHRATTYRLVSWSLFEHGGYTFVVRLCSSREYRQYDPRDAYFAHGRAWPLEALSDRFDPGVFLGRHDRFDPPWPGYERTPPLPEADTHVPLLTQAEEGPATLLLAALYQALVMGVPLVLSAPLEQFTDQGQLPRLVALARLGLPLRLKARCRIRLYSDSPRRHLTQDGAHLLAVPQRHVDEVRLVRPDALVLDWQEVQRLQWVDDREPEWGRARLAGPTLDPACIGYADGVIYRFSKLQEHAPDSLLGFSAGVDCALGEQEAPSQPLIDSLMTLFNIAFARATGKVDDLLLDYLVPNAVEGWGGLPAEQLLTAADLADARPETLVTLLLEPRLPQASVREAQQVQVAGAPQLLRRLAESGLARHSGGHARLPEAQVREWWASFGSGQTGHLAYLRARGLVEPQLCAELTRELPLDTLLQSPGATATLLEAEAGAPGQGQVGSSALAERLQRDQEAFKRFLTTMEFSPSRPTASDALVAWLPHYCLDKRISATWLRELLELAPEPALRSLAQAVGNVWWNAIVQTRQDPTPEVPGWDAVVQTTLDRLLALAQPPPDAIGMFSKVEGRLGTALGFGIALRIHELAARSGPARPSPWTTGKLEVVKDPALQRLFVACALDPAWKSLSPDDLRDIRGSLRLPSAWLPNVLDLLVRSEALLGLLDAASLCGLWDLSRQGAADGPTALPRLLAQLFARDPGLTTSQLIRTGLWFDWITNPQVAGLDPHQAALYWLADPAWRSAAPPVASSGAWTEAMKALGEPPGGGLAEADIQQLTAADGGPAWPWRARYEERQIADLAGRCADLPAVLGLCGVLRTAPCTRTWSLDQIEQAVLDASRFSGVSVHGLHALTSAHPLAGYALQPETRRLPLGEVEAVLRYSGSGVRRAREAFAYTLILALATPERASQADKLTRVHELWAEVWFLELVREWLSASQNLEYLRSLDPTSSPLLREFERHCAALGPASRSTPETADYLWQVELRAAAGALGRQHVLPHSGYQPESPPLSDSLMDCIDGLSGHQGQRHEEAWEALANRAAQLIADPSRGHTTSHPLRALLVRLHELAERQEALPGRLAERGPSTFKSLVTNLRTGRGHHLLCQEAASDGRLPSFDLLCALQPDRSPRVVLWDLLAYPHLDMHLRDRAWWGALFRSLEAPIDCFGDIRHGFPTAQTLNELATHVIGSSASALAHSAARRAVLDAISSYWCSRDETFPDPPTDRVASRY
ncbi:MAG: hypothetical protein ABIO70_28935 [Pseudomonadota bacterium]